MLATTTSVSARASSSSRRCPACKAPMVGTNPIVFRACRCPPSNRRSAAISTTSSAIVFCFYVLDERACSVGQHGIELRVFLGERWRFGGEAEHVVTYQHLPVTSRTRTDSDGGNPQARSY